jgi:hypothetical protein
MLDMVAGIERVICGGVVATGDDADDEECGEPVLASRGGVG